MRIKFLHPVFIILLTLSVFSIALSADLANEPPSPEQLRLRLAESVGQLPPYPGYQLDGRFVLGATGEGILYQARIVQMPRKIAGRTIERRAADFTHENQTRNLRFLMSGLSGEDAWVASPEITADVIAEHVPYMARLDFHALYAALLDILTRGQSAPEFRIEQMDNEIHVHGRLQNGWNAVFILNAMELYPRRVRISTGGEQTAAWMVPYVGLGDVWRPQPFPGWTTEFEVWISSPAPDDYRYARRLDFVERDIVTGSFLVDETRFIIESGAEVEELFFHARAFPWEEGIWFESAGSDRDDIFSDASLYALRSRIDARPWSQWDRYGRRLAHISVISSALSSLLPYLVTPKIFAWILVSGYAFFLFLLLRLCRPRRPGIPPRLRKFPRKTAIIGLFVGLIMFIAGFFAWVTCLPVERSRMALHAAIRFAVTEREIYAASADRFLKNFARDAPSITWEDLGLSSQNYALAYELIRKNLPPQRRAQIETDLFGYARPLLGASSGWRANSHEAAKIASGLGLTGLVIGFEPFIAAAETVIERTLSDQLSDGLHRAGPGLGSAAMDAAVNLFYVLKLAGRSDYYADVRFQEYVSTTLRLLSPAGTLPLFSGTNLDDSLGLSLFFLKIADKIPEESGGQCVASHKLYMEYGLFNSSGWVHRFAFRLLPFFAYYENPHVMLQYETSVAPSELPEESFATTDGQFAALRAGSGADTMYLALNMLRSGSYQTTGDALSFDIFAERSLMLHGSVVSSKDVYYRHIIGNTPIFNDEAQIVNISRGITSALLNQPVFDSVRAVADMAYAHGQVKRDVVMARPEENYPGYFVIMDDIFELDFDTTVRWRAHGRGETVTGFDQRIRWKSTAFEPPGLRRVRSMLEVVYPIGIQGTYSTSPGTLRSRFPFFDQPAQSAQVQWLGGGRLFSIMVPYGEKEQPPIIEAQGEYVCRIGITDWFSFGDITRRITSGAFEHVSEYSLVRSRGQAFPALVMAYGTECRFGEHSIVSNKPVTVSLDGPRGGILNDQPDTRVIIRSPDIRNGALFFLNGHPVVAEQTGVLAFTLSGTGTHLLRSD